MINFRTDVQKAGAMICILGLIGSGKSSLTKALSSVIREEEGECAELYEPASKTNPYLADFYTDGARWGFTIQVFLLNRRLEQHRYAQALSLSGRASVADSSVFSDSCFVSLLEKDGVITHREADTYFELFRNMSRELLYPSAFIFLDTAPEIALSRIEKRISEKESRRCEAGIPIDYLRSLQAEYNELLNGLGRFSHVLRLDWNQSLDDRALSLEAARVWEKVKALRDIPIPCQMGVW